MPYMDRLMLGVVTLGSVAVSWVAPGWPWVSGIATALVGVVGLITTVKLERRAIREEGRAEEAEARAKREEQRAIRAEQRAEAAERREREAHAWERERHDDEAASAAEIRAVREWVQGKKRHSPTQSNGFEFVTRVVASSMVNPRSSREFPAREDDATNRLLMALRVVKEGTLGQGS